MASWQGKGDPPGIDVGQFSLRILALSDLLAAKATLNIACQTLVATGKKAASRVRTIAGAAHP
jgi:hypothetical protein